MRIPKFILILLIMISCTISRNEIIEIAEINYYNSKDENLKLAQDLVNYNYNYFIKSDLPNINENVLGGMNWHYFNPSNDNKILFRIRLSNRAVREKDILIEFFKEKVNELINIHTSNIYPFQQAVSFSNINIKYLDNMQYESVWNNAGGVMQNFNSKDDFIKSLSKRENIINNEIKRSFQSKQYYSELPSVGKGNFYIINYSFGENNIINERLTLQFIEDTFNIVKYEYTLH